MPKEVACELLTYIAEKETFANVCKELGSDITDIQVKALLREVVRGLQEELKTEKGPEYDPTKCNFLSTDAKKIITYLSPKEEKTLLKAFGLAEDQTK
jgi:hypothetical protein